MRAWIGRKEITSRPGGRAVTGALTNWGLLRAVLVGFALLVVWRFLAEVAGIFLLLATALLLAVALSAPVEALYRRKVPRPAAVAGLVVSALAVLVPHANS